MTRQVLVTGASKGIGKAIAVQLAKDGFTIAVHYMGDKKGAEQTLDTIIENGGNGRLIQFDISNREECRTKLETILLNMVRTMVLSTTLALLVILHFLR